MAAIVPICAFSISLGSALVALSVPQPKSLSYLASHLIFGVLAFVRVTDIITTPDHASVLGLFLLIWMSHMTCVLLLEKQTLPKRPNEWDLKAAYKNLFNARRLGLDNQAPLSEASCSGQTTTDSYSNKSRSKASIYSIRGARGTGISQRQRFLLARLFSAVAILGINHCYTQIFHIFRPLDISDFVTSKQSHFRRVHEVTGRETIVRSWLVIHFVWSAWATFTSLHDILAFIAVGIGLDEASEWPQLYGSPYQMYTVRRFWGKFWHRLVLRTNGTLATFLSQNILKFRRGSLLDKALISLFIFVLSGTVHALVTLQLGFSCGYWEDIWWFTANYAAILVEGSIFWLTRRLLGRNTRSNTLSKAAGSFRVFGFLFWSLPKSQYPKIRCGST